MNKLENLSTQLNQIRNINFAWTTLVTKSNYIIGAIRLFQSIKYFKSKYPVEILVTNNLLDQDLKLFNDYNIPYRKVDLLQFTNKPYLINPVYNDTLSKFNILTLTEYSRVCFLDADFFVTKNIDYIFDKLIDINKEYNCVKCISDELKYAGGIFIVKPDLIKYNYYKSLHHKNGIQFANDEDLLKQLPKEDIKIIGDNSIEKEKYLDGFVHLGGFPKPWEKFKPNTELYNWFYKMPIEKFMTYYFEHSNNYFWVILDGECNG